MKLHSGLESFPFRRSGGVPRVVCFELTVCRGGRLSCALLEGPQARWGIVGFCSGGACAQN